MRVKGQWPDRVELTAGWARAVVRPWNDDLPAAALRLERGGSRFLTECARICLQWCPEILSPATLPQGARLWKEAGFVEADRLRLMEHILQGLGDPSPEIVSGGLDPFDEILRIDNESFDLRWRLGHLGLTESFRATPTAVVHRHRSDGLTTGFAVSGVGLGAGYLQRLAVAAEYRRRGIGEALVKTAARWALNHGARVMLVNTQMDNHGAAELYRRLGFAEVPGGLLLFRYQAN